MISIANEVRPGRNNRHAHSKSVMAKREQYKSQNNPKGEFEMAAIGGLKKYGAGQRSAGSSDPRMYLAIAAIFVIGMVIGVGIGQFISFPHEKTYSGAVADAMIAEESEIYSGLVPITKANANLTWENNSANISSDRVLVVTWTKYASSYPVGASVNLTWGDVWVAVPYEIKAFFHGHEFDNRTLRCEQLMGLPEGSNKTSFVEIYVRPQDLFRPSPDNEINDTVAQLTFPNGTDANYTKWFNDNIVYSYYGAKQFPWTRLGYTYDWGNANSDVGLSEFVIRSGSQVAVRGVEATAAYLA